MKKVLSGNHAAAVAAQLARTQVSVGYPITLATQVFEALAEMKSKGEFPGEFIAAESEHSVMRPCSAPRPPARAPSPLRLARGLS